jgi:hypothetical protein
MRRAATCARSCDPLVQKHDFELPNDHLEALKAILPDVHDIVVIGWKGADEQFVRLIAEHIQRFRGYVVSARNPYQAVKTFDDERIPLEPIQAS